VVVFLPGLTLQVLAVGIWAMVESSVPGWVVFGIVLAVAIAATVLKYLFPGRRLREAGIPGWLLLVAVLIAIVGLFVIPVVGAPIGFVVTVYAFERARRGRERAWPSTKMALRAVLMSIGIELAGGFLIAVAFFGGALLF
jgi:hypothetical protein